MRDRHAL